jgi:hypothetical protein
MLYATNIIYVPSYSKYFATLVAEPEIAVITNSN